MECEAVWVGERRASEETLRVLHGQPAPPDEQQSAATSDGGRPKVSPLPRRVLSRASDSTDGVLK
jgi:hypothetical protein